MAEAAAELARCTREKAAVEVPMCLPLVLWPGAVSDLSSMVRLAAICC